MKTILMTGGGSAGHVTPNIALIPALQEAGFRVHYAGLKDGIERKLIEKVDGVEFHEIESGKLRRYLSLKNLASPFKVIKGLSQAKKLVRELKQATDVGDGYYILDQTVSAG